MEAAKNIYLFNKETQYLQASCTLEQKQSGLFDPFIHFCTFHAQIGSPCVAWPMAIACANKAFVFRS